MFFIHSWRHEAPIKNKHLTKLTELLSHRVTDTQGYSVYGWVKFVVPDFKKLPYLLCSQWDKLSRKQPLVFNQHQQRTTIRTTSANCLHSGILITPLIFCPLQDTRQPVNENVMKYELVKLEINCFCSKNCCRPGLRFTKLYYHSFLYQQSFSLEK